MTTATVTWSAIDSALDEIEKYIERTDDGTLINDYDEYGVKYHEDDYEVEHDLQYPLFDNWADDEAFSYFDEAPTDEQVARFSKAKKAFKNKVALRILSEGLDWVEGLSAGQVKEDCLQKIRDFLAKH